MSGVEWRAMLPCATADLPGTGGTFVVRGDDCLCEEVLARKPDGDGHWWVQVARLDLATTPCRTAVGRAVGVPVEKVAFAGHRDRRGRSVQWFSVPADLVEHPQALRNAGTQGKMRVLQIHPSSRPVNDRSVARLRWRVRIRGAAAGDGYRLAQAILARLRVGGCPNYVPAAQLGPDGSYAKWGRLLLKGGRLPAAVAKQGVPRGRCLAAAQHGLFNRWLALRVADSLLARCLDGEVVRGARGVDEVIADVEHGQRRLDSWEAVPLGPLYGDGMSAAAREAAQREAAALAEAGFDAAAVAELHGGRRAARFQPAKVQCDLDGKDLVLDCELPTECAIDTVVDEIVKPRRNGDGRSRGGDEEADD